MPKFSQKEFEKQGKKIDDLEKDVKFLKDLLFKVKGQPIVQGYAGKRFDLNENLNVVLLNTRISDLEDMFVEHLTKNYLGGSIYESV